MIKKFTLLSCLICLSIMAYGQQGLVGFTNIELIVFNLPETAEVNTELETYRSVLADRINTKSEQFNLYIEAYQKMQDDPTTPDSIRQVKQLDFINRQNEVEEYNKSMEKIYADKQAELFQPVYKKVQEAINAVRIDKGFGLILNSQIGSTANYILAYDENCDITFAVFEKLGVPIPESFLPKTDAEAKAEDGNEDGNGNGNK